MNKMQIASDAPKCRRLSVVFTVFFVVGLFSTIATYAVTR